MAGERKGKTYEALVKVGLDHLRATRKLIGSVFWNIKASGMTVTPDFTVGVDADHPHSVLLITHSGSAKESEKKNWRNLGELAESKLRLQSIPKVFSVAFDSVVKDSLKAVGAAAFDGQLIVGDRPYGASLVQWIDKHHESLPKTGNAKADAIQKLIDKRDAELSPLFSALVSDLIKLLKMSNPALNALWTMERTRSCGKAPTTKTTSVRRGLSKLLIFEDLDLALRLYRGKRVPLADVPQYAFDLKLAGKSIARASAIDAEVASAASLLTDHQIKAILGSFDASKVAGSLTTLRNSPHLTFMRDYVIAEYSQLCDPKVLFDRMEELHRDPWALVNRRHAPPNWPPGGVWLFDFILELLKDISKNANGYGFAQLGADVIRSGYGTVADMKSANGFGGGFGLSGWARREPRSKFSKTLLKGVAHVLANHLSRSTLANVTNAAQSQISQMVDTILNVKLCTYSGFDPLEILLRSAVAGFTHIRMRACYAEAAGLAGAAAVMQLAKAKATLINWQSATDEGKDHKVKELCGRAAALRYSWDSNGKSFVARPGVKKLCLLVDGTWTQSDLDTLVLAGWDEVFYPDEVLKLAKAIV